MRLTHSRPTDPLLDINSKINAAMLTYTYNSNRLQWHGLLSRSQKQHEGVQLIEVLMQFQQLPQRHPTARAKRRLASYEFKDTATSRAVSACNWQSGALRTLSLDSGGPSNACTDGGVVLFCPSTVSVLAMMLKSCAERLSCYSSVVRT